MAVVIAAWGLPAIVPGPQAYRPQHCSSTGAKADGVGPSSFNGECIEKNQTSARICVVVLLNSHVDVGVACVLIAFRHHQVRGPLDERLREAVLRIGLAVAVAAVVLPRQPAPVRNDIAGTLSDECKPDARKIVAAYSAGVWPMAAIPSSLFMVRRIEKTSFSLSQSSVSQRSYTSTAESVAAIGRSEV